MRHFCTYRCTCACYMCTARFRAGLCLDVDSKARVEAGVDTWLAAVRTNSKWQSQRLISHLMTTPTRQLQVQTLVNLPRRLDGLECRNMDRSARGTIAPAGGAKTSPSRDTAAVSAEQLTTPTPATNTFCPAKCTTLGNPAFAASV